MAEQFHLKIVAPERVVFDRDVVSVTAPGADGYFGVLAHHAPMLAEIGIGRLVATVDAGSETVLAVSGGFADVRGKTMNILTDAAEVREEIDLKRAEEALARGRERLVHQGPDVDVPRAQAAVMRALNRLSVASGR